MGVGSAARNYSRFQTQTPRSKPAAPAAQESGCDWDDIADDVWAKCLQDPPSAAADDQKVVIEFSTFAACLRTLLSSDDDWQQDATVTVVPAHQEPRHGVHRRAASPADKDAARGNCTQAVEEVCI